MTQWYRVRIHAMTIYALHSHTQQHNTFMTEETNENSKCGRTHSFGQCLLNISGYLIWISMFVDRKFFEITYQASAPKALYSILYITLRNRLWFSAKESKFYRLHFANRSYLQFKQRAHTKKEEKKQRPPTTYGLKW